MAEWKQELRAILELVGRDLLGPQHRDFQQMLVELHRQGFLGDQELSLLKMVLSEDNPGQLSREAIQYVMDLAGRLMQAAREPRQER